jgi:hypothetical protein
MGMRTASTAQADLDHSEILQLVELMIEWGNGLG